ncbi:hypothetical protein OVA24_18430 [Luteolibacter sp. SL250]|uniref:hypothetical protein n=1 Tax=Luteolibacter sp. SL250 TaxID=2995170 RepID=UPI002270DE3F|nr:hypothetical protein [Luteolibacter sp. SL250]WAC19206.1 hypothetical protein OVA24_18430 [Luteolibacter sp. SL250]
MVPSLTFFCPACKSRLTVPLSMAGVRGPCPICSSFIEAPQPPVSAAPTQAVQQAPQHYGPPAQQAPPYYTPPAQPYAPPAQPYAPPAQPYAPPAQPAPQQYVPPAQPAPQQYAPPAQQTPHHHAPPYAPPQDAPPSSHPQQGTLPPPRSTSAGPSVVKVEPRGNRLRSTEHQEIVARPISERQGAGQPQVEGRDYRPLPTRSRITSRLLISGAALLLMVGVSAGLILLSREDPEATAPPVTPSQPRATKPDPEPSSAPETARNTAPAPTPPGPATPATPPTPGTPPAPEPPHPGTAAMEVVEKFLAASNLDARLPLIDTQTPPADLQDSILAKPFPPDPTVAPEVQETNPDDSMDFYYAVDFKDAAGKTHPELLLVHTPAGGSPKVIVDPFLDSFGGRLAAFASQPSDKIRSFQSVISAVAQTTADRNVPDHENKLRLKLLPRDNEKEITSAYFTKGSKLGQMLITEGSGFRYGQARTARVTLRWNKEEDPANPYLEVTDIKEFRWNP